MGGAVGNARTHAGRPAGGPASAGAPATSGSRSPSLTRPKAFPRAKTAQSPINTLERSTVRNKFWRRREERAVLEKRFFTEEDGDDNSFDRLSRQSAERLRQAILEIDEEGSAADRWPSIEEWRTGAFAAGFMALSAMAMDPWAQALADEGEEAAAASGDVVSQVGAVFSQQGVILFTPLLLYLVFLVYRTSLNPKAKVTDFLFLVASFFIIFNIISIVFFKTRYF